MIYTHKLARGLGCLGQYGIGLARASSLPEEVVQRAEQMAKDIVQANGVSFFGTLGNFRV